MLKRKKIELDEYFPYLLHTISSQILLGTSTIMVGSYRIGVREWRSLAQMANQGPTSNKDICDTSYMDKGSTTRALQFLEELKLIQQVPSPEGDWRSKFYDLTQEGVAVYNEIVTEKLARADRLWSDMKIKEQKELIRLLKKLKASVNKNILLEKT